MTGEPQEGQERQPTPEEFALALAERLARTPVRDVVLQSLATFIDMAGVRLGLGPHGPDPTDLGQARQAIEAARALADVAEREMGAAQVRPFREPLAHLQMIFARAVEEQADEGASEADGGEGAPSPGPAPSAAPDAASRLWVPPGSRRDA